MRTRVTQVSFTRGELSPRLDARTNLEQYGIGLKSAKNAIIHQEGGISNRMGLEFCTKVKDSLKPVRTMRFVFNTTQTYMLEFGEKYIRFLKDGAYIIYPDDYEDESKRGQIVEIESPYEAADLARIKTSRAGDILTLTYTGKYKTKNLVRYSHYDWKLEDAVFAPDIAAPTGVSAKWTGSTSENTRKYEYVVTAVDEKTNEESTCSDVVSATGHREANWLTTEEMTITWEAVEGASEYNIYRSVNGIFGYIGTSETLSFVDDNIEPDLSSSAPVPKDPFKDGENPGCSCYFQQRKIYGDLPNSPQAICTSQTGAINNFNVSRPLIATDAITINIDGNEEVRHLIPMKDLLVLTADAEWMVNGTDGIMQANPAPAAVIQSCYGASHVEPIVSGSMIIFVQSGGSVIRDLGYDLMTDKYDGDELSLFSNHLFEGKEVKCMAYAKEPYRLAFVVFTDGTAAVMTYNKKQKLCGWSPYTTDGLFEWVDVVREGLEDVAYFVIKRNINGEDVKYIERTKSRIINNVKDAFLVDSGLCGEFDEEISVIRGLDHLEGKTLVANADGGIIENLIVKDGEVKLPRPVKKIIIGLPYEFDFESLNIEGENTQGLKKVLNHASVKIHKSREDFLFVGADGIAFRNARSLSSINDAGQLFSSDIDSTIIAEPSTEATIHIKQNLPLPLTILSFSTTVEVQDPENN